MTSKQSLEELLPIIKMLMEVKGNEMSEVPIVLVGNKTDEKDVGIFVQSRVRKICDRQTFC